MKIKPILLIMFLLIDSFIIINVFKENSHVMFRYKLKKFLLTVFLVIYYITVRIMSNGNRVLKLVAGEDIRKFFLLSEQGIACHTSSYSF